MLPQHEIILFIVKNWENINYEEARELVNYALYAKSSYFCEVNENGMWTLKNQMDSSLDEIFIYIQNQRQPLTLRQLTNKFRSFESATLNLGLSMDIRFSVINSRNVDYWILSNWELANDILYEHMQRERIDSIHYPEIIELLNNVYGMDALTLLFSPLIDERFRMSGKLVSIDLTGREELKGEVEELPEVLEEVARSGLLVCKYIEQKQRVNTSNIVVNIFGIKLFEKQFQMYCRAVDKFLSTINEFNTDGAGEWSFNKKTTLEEPDILINPFWNYSVRGSQIQSPLEITDADNFNGKILNDFAEQSDIEQINYGDNNAKKTGKVHFITYYERVKGYISISMDWKPILQTNSDRTVNVVVDGFSYLWNISKGENGLYFFGNGVMDFFCDYSLIPGHKIITELVSANEIKVRIGKVDEERANDQARLLDIGKLVNESKQINKSFFGLMVEVLATYPSGIHNMVLFEKVNTIRSSNHSTISSLLYSNKCFVQLEEKKGYWKLDLARLTRVHIDEKGNEFEDEIDESVSEKNVSKATVKVVKTNNSFENDHEYEVPDLWKTFSRWSKSQSGHSFTKLSEKALNKEDLQHLVVRSYSKLVCKLASNRATHSMDRMDFVQEGFLGLLKAIDLYKDSEISAFGNYAKYHIRSRMSRKAGDNQSIIRIPVHMNSTINEYEKSVNEIIADQGEWPTFFQEEVGKWDVKKIKEMERLIALKNVDYISFEQCWDRESEERLSPYPWDILNVLDTKSNRLYFEEQSTPLLMEELDKLCDIAEEDSEFFCELGEIDDTIILKDLRDKLDYCLGCLTERQERVIRLRFGFDDDQDRTLEEVARYFGVTRERIRQIESKALNELQGFLGPLNFEKWLPLP